MNPADDAEMLQIIEKMLIPLTSAVKVVEERMKSQVTHTTGARSLEDKFDTVDGKLSEIQDELGAMRKMLDDYRRENALLHEELDTIKKHLLPMLGKLASSSSQSHHESHRLTDGGPHTSSLFEPDHTDPSRTPASDSRYKMAIKAIFGM